MFLPHFDVFCDLLFHVATEKCPLSVLTRVRIKRVNLRKYELFVGTNGSVHIKRVSVQWGFPVEKTQ